MRERDSRTLRLVGFTACLIALFTHDASLQKNKAASTITEASVRGHMEFLASDAMKGRGSGTEDEWRAATYIGSQMRRWGIEPLGDNGGFVKRITTTRTTITAPPTLTVRNARFTHGGEMLVQVIGRGSVSGPTHVYKAGTAAPAGSVVIVPDGVTPPAEELQAAAIVITVETPQIRSTWDSAGAQMPGTGAG